MHLTETSQDVQRCLLHVNLTLAIAARGMNLHAPLQVGGKGLAATVVLLLDGGAVVLRVRDVRVAQSSKLQQVP